MARIPAISEVACVDETHYIHLGENGSGKPCNSSIGPSAWSGFDDNDPDYPLPTWHCIGCGMFWDEMPAMEPEGLNALCRMHPAPEQPHE